MRKDFGECIASQREGCGETLESRDGPGFPGAVGFGDNLRHSGVRRNGSSDPEQK